MGLAAVRIGVMGNPWWKYEHRPASEFKFTLAIVFTAFTGFQYSVGNYALAAGMAVVSAGYYWLGIRDRRRERGSQAQPRPEIWRLGQIEREATGAVEWRE